MAAVLWIVRIRRETKYSGKREVRLIRKTNGWSHKSFKFICEIYTKSLLPWCPSLLLVLLTITKCVSLKWIHIWLLRTDYASGVVDLTFGAHLNLAHHEGNQRSLQSIEQRKLLSTDLRVMRQVRCPQCNNHHNLKLAPNLDYFSLLFLIPHLRCTRCYQFRPCTSNVKSTGFLLILEYR